MYYKALKHIAIENRVLKQFNKKFGLKICGEHLPLMFVVYQIHSSGKQVTTRKIALIYKLIGKSYNTSYISPALSYFETIGYIDKTVYIKKGFRANIYSINPLLVQHLGILEQLFKKVRWDY